jgi:UDP-glucose 4-epimerase
MRLTGKRVLVTGGAGFIGSHLVDRLVEADNEIVIVDDFSFGKEENISHHRESTQVRIEKADICDSERMMRLANGMDIIFHLAVFCLRNSLHDPIRSHEVNATGSLIMCQAALQNNVKKFVYVSTAEVYGTGLYFPIDEGHPFLPTNVYGAAKAVGELYARSYWKTYDLPIVITRLFNTYGPREHSEGRRAEVIPRFVMRTLAGQRSLIFGTGQQTRDFTYVDDIVRGILMAAECDEIIGDSVNLARGQDVSVATIYELILKKLDRFDLEPLYIQEGRPADIDRMHADVSMAQEMLGFEAEVSIEQGLDRYIEWVQRQKPDLVRWWEQEKAIRW